MKAATNEQLDTMIATAARAATIAGLDTTPELDALFTERAARIAERQRQIKTAEAKWNREIAKAARELTKPNLRRWLKLGGTDPKTATWTELNEAIVAILGDRCPHDHPTQEQNEAIWARAENWTDRF